MSLKVSLTIDGDASGAVEAADAAKTAIGDLGKQTESISKAIEDGFGKAIASIEKNAKGVQEANDNAAGSGTKLAQAFNQVASGALGADSAIVKAAQGATGFAKGVGDLLKSVGTMPLVTGAIVLAYNAAQTFFDIINREGRNAEVRLQENARLVGVVRDAYSDAAKTAGEFLQQSRAVTQLQAQQNLIALQRDLQRTAAPLSRVDAPFPTQAIGGEFSVLDVGGAQAADNLDPFREATDNLRTSIAAGKPDLEAYRDAIAAIGNAAAASNPALAAAAAARLKDSEEAAKFHREVKQGEAILAQLNGTATDTQKKMLGISTTTSQTVNEFDRLTKSLQRQAAAQEAEAATVGKSAGEVAKLRTEHLLLEAAQQAGIKVTGEYAEKMNTVANRLGAAAQKAAEARLASDINFERSQLGRDPGDAAIADRLRGAHGDNVEAHMNGAAASAMRANDNFRELRSTTIGLAQGAFREFNAAVDGGKTRLQALGDVGVNALKRIAERASDKILENALTRLFGAFLPSGTSQMVGGYNVGATGGINPFPTPFASGGWTGAGGKYEPAGIVHRGEYVFDADSTRAAGGPDVLDAMRRGLRGYADGGFVEGVTPWRRAGNDNTGNGASRLNVQNNVYNSVSGARARTETRQNADGGLSIDTFVDQVEEQLASRIAGGGSAMNQAVGLRYRLTPARGNGYKP